MLTGEKRAEQVQFYFDILQDALDVTARAELGQFGTGNLYELKWPGASADTLAVAWDISTLPSDRIGSPVVQNCRAALARLGLRRDGNRDGCLSRLVLVLQFGLDHWQREIPSFESSLCALRLRGLQC